MKQFILCVFILCFTSLAFSQKVVSVDLTNLGLMMAYNGEFPKHNQYNLRLNYENRLSDSTSITYSLRFSESSDVRIYEINQLEQHSDIFGNFQFTFTKKKYPKHRLMNSAFWGYYGCVSWMYEIERVEYLESDHIWANEIYTPFIGGGFTVGNTFLIQRFFIGVEIGAGLGIAMNEDIYTSENFYGMAAISNSAITLSPSFFNINLGYKF